MIPKQLKNNKFGFVKLKNKSKCPFEKKWQKNPYSYQRINSWLQEGNTNYGVIGGCGDLIIIDADTNELAKTIFKELPSTFTVKTNKGYHFYYICSDIKKKIVIKNSKGHYGEILSCGSCVVASGSIHPETGTKYIVEKDLQIVNISKEEVFSAIYSYIEVKYPKTNKIDKVVLLK